MQLGQAGSFPECSKRIAARHSAMPQRLRYGFRFRPIGKPDPLTAMKGHDFLKDCAHETRQVIPNT
jgi:hypothetical protein